MICPVMTFVSKKPPLFVLSPVLPALTFLNIQIPSLATFLGNQVPRLSSIWGTFRILSRTRVNHARRVIDLSSGKIKQAFQGGAMESLGLCLFFVLSFNAFRPMAAAYGEFDEEICTAPWNAVQFGFSAAAGPETEVNPETCWIQCLKQIPDLVAIAFTKTRQGELICLCPATDTLATINADEVSSTMCQNCISPNNVQPFLCGSNRGLLGVLRKSTPSAVLTGLDAVLEDSDSTAITADYATEKLVGLAISFTGGARVDCNKNLGCPHPAEVKVNYGDGSGDQYFNSKIGQTTNIWTHIYAFPGKFTVSVQARNIYTNAKESLTKEISIYEDIGPLWSANHGVELSCPPLVRPGQYFYCMVDFRPGSNLQISLKMTDDITNHIDVNTNLMSVPDYWFDIPGKTLKSSAYNQTTHVTDGSGFFYALPVTSFDTMANVSKFEIAVLTGGLLKFSIAEPICGSGLVWCLLTKMCESKCKSAFQANELELECAAEVNKDFCSLEGSCHDLLSCPVSFTGSEGAKPVAYKPLWSVELTIPPPDTSGEKRILNFPKPLYQDPKRNNENYRLRDSKAFPRGSILVAQCPDASNCPKIFYWDTEGDDGDIPIKSEMGGLFILNEVDTPARQHAIRVVTYEERHLRLEEKFFCDKPTEKTVSMRVLTHIGLLVHEYRTPKISCQYPIMEIYDLSLDNPNNPPFIPFTVKKPLPTRAEILQRKTPNRTEYEAEMWLMNGQTFTWDVKFGSGSHLIVNWIETNQPDDPCSITGDSIDPAPGGGIALDTNVDTTCVFPFRYDSTSKILHYGCTNITSMASTPICATEVDLDNLATKVGVCKKICHVQQERVIEVDQAPLNVSLTQEGNTFFQKDYRLPIETTISLQREFDQPGKIFKVELNAQNELVPEDRAHLAWTIICANPIVPDDWILAYDPFNRPEDLFKFSIIIGADKPMPTRPILKIFPIEGRQVLTNNIKIDTTNPLTFFVVSNDLNDTRCSDGFDIRCVKEYEFHAMGVDPNAESGPNGVEIEIGLPGLSSGIRGFSVHFYNPISSIKYHHDDQSTATEEITVLDAGPTSTGEWVAVTVTKWDVNFLESYSQLTEPITSNLKYSLPNEFGSNEFPCDFVEDRFYLPASGIPAFSVGAFSGNVRRVKYEFSNQDPTGYFPPPCFVDWPVEVLPNTWKINHCPNITEGTYDLQLGVWNPLDDWLYTEPVTVEVLSRCGPISIADGGIITDADEPRDFTVTLERAGLRTCVTVDWGNGDPLEFYGNLDSCRIRYRTLVASDVKEFNHISKTIKSTRVFRSRGLYEVNATAFDIRHFVETSLPITVFNMPCNSPQTWIALNYTSVENPELIPGKLKAKKVEFHAVSDIKCTKPTPTYMTWRLYEVYLIPDESSQIGVKEDLIELPLNNTNPSWNSSILSLPPMTYDFGLYKAVFKLEVETFDPDIPVFDESFTYFRVVPSPLVPVILEGSASKVSRGWGQIIKLNPKSLSIDPDAPHAKDFTYQWFCRSVLPKPENYSFVDAKGWPVYVESEAQIIRAPGRAKAIQAPPGCFGNGAGPLKSGAGKIDFNTSSFITFSRTFEFTLILIKDTRRAIATLRVEVTSVPPPITTVACLSLENMCFPSFKGFFINPTKRLAIVGDCKDSCDGDVSYLWSIHEITALGEYKKLTYSQCASGITLPTTGAITVTLPTTTVTTEAPFVRTVTTVLTTYGSNLFASSSFPGDSNGSVATTELAIGDLYPAPTGSKRRRKRQVLDADDTQKLGPALPNGCEYVFGDGRTDARDSDDLALREMFFKINPQVKTFRITLNATNTIHNGQRHISSSGTSYLDVIINQPPENGTCDLTVKTIESNGEEHWKWTSDGRSLKDVFRLVCSNWVDPDEHEITKFVFKATLLDSEHPPIFLYSGPRPDIFMILPVGRYKLEALIHESGGTFANYVISPNFNSYAPTQEDYESVDVNAEVAFFKSMGDGSRVAQILAADASIRMLAKYLDPSLKLSQLGTSVNGTNGTDIAYSEADISVIEDLLKELALSNVNALKSAKDAFGYQTLDELNQGAGLLYSITAGLNRNDLMAKTIDMEGRQAAVDMIAKMNAGFEHVVKNEPVDNPNDFADFIKGTSGSAMALIENLNRIIFAEDFGAIPPSDLDAALSMPYDTDIGEGRDADIPDDPNDAMKFNVMKLVQVSAKRSINEMIDLLDQAGKTVVMNSVQGEELKTNSPNGIKMIMAKIPWSKTIGRDTDGDGWPDVPLRFEFDDSDSVIQFPLGYCPGDRKNVSDPQINFKCIGEWGFVLKEWETITKVYPESAKNLNPVTKQIDIDVYDSDGNWVDVSGMEHWIQFVIGRIRVKNPEAVRVPESARAHVVMADRIASLTRRNKPFIIYHELNVSIEFASLNIQIKIDENAGNASNVVILARNGKMPLLDQCDFVRKVRDIADLAGDYRDWFVSMEQINNRTGKWYLAVVALKNMGDVDNIVDDAPCSEQTLAKDMLTSDFKTKAYTMKTFTSGCYFLNNAVDEWRSVGMTVLNTSNLVTACGSNHLTSFATGFFPQINTIDFDFIFAHASFEDNLTIYLMVIICFFFYFLAMIWAILKDRKDLAALKVPLLKDNNPEHTYFYEIIVETGPLNAHATTSNIEFILFGDDNETDVRCFADPERAIFQAGALDPFLMSTEYPLGDLKYLRIWQDNTGLGNMGAWYLLSVSVFDIQTGESSRFVADQWLAIDRGTYEDDITLHAMSQDDAADAFYLMKSAGNRKLCDNHLWWSVYTRPIRSRFTRCQRVSLCMAMLCLSMLANAMFYGTMPGRVVDPYFSLGMLSFDPVDIGVGFLSNLIVFLPILLATFLFKSSAVFKKRTSRFDLALDDAKDEGSFFPPAETYSPVYKPGVVKQWKSLPMVLHIFGWIFTVVCILGGALLVFSFGISFGNEKTYQWAVSMISAFFSSVLITQPIWIAIITFAISLCWRRSKMGDDHTNSDEKAPTIYWDPDKPPQKRPRKHKPKRRMLEENFLADLTRRKLQEMEMKTVLRDLVIYFFYVVIIFIISYGNRDPNSFLQKEALEKSVVHGALNCEVLPDDDPNFQSCDPDDVPEPFVDFMKVRDPNEWWYWMDRTLKPNVRVQPWYNGRQPYGLKGYLNDRVNRLIGYAIVRQVREEIGTCKPAKVIRDAVETCTGSGGLTVEDDRDYCEGWKQYEVGGDNTNCTEAPEFRFTSATELESTPLSAGINTYGGGGYVFRIKGFIGEVEERVQMLKESNWIDNRTRAVFVEFSVYNAQVNIFGIVTCVAEFVGGGIQPWFRVDAVRLFANSDGFGFVTSIAEVLFVVAFFYYVVNVIVVMKSEGSSKFFSSTWNILDLFTVVLSLIAIILYVVRLLITREMTKRFDETKGNAYIRLSYASIVDEYFTYVVSFTVFTSTLKFCRLLSFQKAFMQVAATIRLCFEGLSTFLVEFSIVFGGFTSFFYFVLKNDLDNFRDFIRSLENTMAMSIGKFNFAALRAADEMAAWIFFIFSVVVNMILINMMMAIINLAFEEIKSNEADFKNRFELVDYIKRTSREVIGLSVAQPVKPIFKDDNDDDLDENDTAPTDGTGDVSTDFSNKTDQLLKYIENTYLNGFFDDGDKMIHKMKSTDPGDKKLMNYGFDALFMEDSDPKKKK